MKDSGADAMLYKAKKVVVDYFNSGVDVAEGNRIKMEDVYITWFCKTLQNWKVLVGTIVNDGMYYEVTHDGDKDCTHVDVYKKHRNFTVR